MESEFSNAFPESCAMKGGEGPHSYARNSTFQRSAIEAAKKLLQSAVIDNFDLKTTCGSSGNQIRIADFGCSTGPNTFIAAQNIIEAVQLKYQSQSQNQSTPEFFVFFNDQASNDFNTLFQKLPPNRNYFAAGVPGSFYGRLFPSQSLHLVHSSSSLSWLSKMPKELTDRNCGAWNKGRIFYTNAPKEVEDAYEGQFKMDLATFLQARAQELVGNGIMILMIPAAHDVIDFSVDLYGGKDYEVLGSCLMDMAKLGLISEEKVDTFNVPTYFPRLKDLKKMLESNEDLSVEKMDLLDGNNLIIEPNLGRHVSQCRAAFEVLIEKHFGDGIVDELFDRFAQKLMKSPQLTMYPQKLKLVMLFVVLKRKV
ncbi:probable S-adenosylmethionine-dependent methyltransferase At5g37990 [Neltuma alba]|uniref:probable S-adenosylmethionine-dependent methyltransferase At5g37990 n=1 Tax=Neltuma alba TaxID=207710 RepID=UPI0010A3D325|nr:probable S-adenosylmethionine-dependent methyltransferase At5g37990 [Prosopis alba]